MSFPNPRYDPSRRRRGARHRHPPASHHSPLTSLATTAAIAYGAYRVGTWAWNTYFGIDDDDDNKNEIENDNDDDNDLLYEWTEDYRAVKRDIRQEEGFSPFASDEETDDNEDSPNDNNNGQILRSRRSRIKWGDSHDRSNSPSPSKDYHHHENEGGGGGDGMVKQGMMKKAAAMATTGLGSAVSAGITAGIQSYNEKSQPPANNSIIPDQERRLRMGRCRLEASRAMMDFLPTLKKAIVKETDVTQETDELKQLRIKKREIAGFIVDNGDSETNQIIGEGVKNEEDVIREKERRLWNEIKNKSMTRLVTTIYAHTIVFLVLTVQVNLLGGRLLREDMEGKESSSSESLPPPDGTDRYRSSHQTVLAKTYHYLFTKGIPSLAESVGKAVEEILQQWDVLGGADASLRDVSTWVERVRDIIEQRQEKEEVMSHLVKFVIPPEGGAAAAADAETKETDATEDELAKYILDETYDLLESPTFNMAERQCLDTTFAQLRMRVLGKLFLLEDSIPLATVVTHLQKTAVSTFYKPPSHKEEMKNWGGVLGMMEEPLPSVPNDYISKLERLEAVVELSDVCF